MEILDLYDNSFNKLHQTIVRRVDEIPEGANIMQSYILILNNDKYLLEQSTEKNNYKLAIPGGHILTGENAEQGLKRELKEELGLEINNIEHIDTIKFPYNKYIFNIFFTDNKINIDRLTLQKEEVSQVKWYSKDEILKLIEEEKIPIGYAYILKEYMRN
jgi:NADH pyrophosphatase NudC (nudix superfamily)